MDSNHDASDSNRSECYMHKEPRRAWQSLELRCVTHCRNHTNWHEDSCTAAGQLIFPAEATRNCTVPSIRI